MEGSRSTDKIKNKCYYRCVRYKRRLHNTTYSRNQPNTVGWAVAFHKRYQIYKLIIVLLFLDKASQIASISLLSLDGSCHRRTNSVKSGLTYLPWLIQKYFTFLMVTEKHVSNHFHVCHFKKQKRRKERIGSCFWNNFEALKINRKIFWKGL